MNWRGLLRYLDLTLPAVFLLAAFAMPVLAQDTPQSGNAYGEIPDRYIEEAHKFHDYCDADASMNQYFDCRCLAVKYLDERIRRGDGIDSTGILQSINGECHDATQAAGYQYEQCMDGGGGVNLPDDLTLGQYCYCYANTYGKLYEMYKTAPSSRSFVRIQSQAIVTCRNPEIAKKLYPYQPKQ